MSAKSTALLAAFLLRFCAQCSNVTGKGTALNAHSRQNKALVGQLLPWCPLPPPAGPVANFIGGNCDITTANIKSYSSSIGVTACAANCYALPNCWFFAFNSHGCYLFPNTTDPVGTGFIQLNNTAGNYSLYWRGTCLKASSPYCN